MAQKFFQLIRARFFNTAADTAIDVGVKNEVNPRLAIDAGGKLNWGDGTLSPDTNLYRSDTNTLKTDDTLVAENGIVTLTSTGEPSANVPNGGLAVDTTNNYVYLRSNNEWNLNSGIVVPSDDAPENTSLMWLDTTASPFDYSPTLLLDANNATTQTWPNLGTAGSILNAKVGSTTSADTNDPLLLTRTTENYVYLTGVSNNGIVLAPSPALNITGDIDLRVHVALNDWTPASSNQTLIAKSITALSTQSYVLAIVAPTGLVRLVVTDSTLTNRVILSTVAPTIADGSTLWIRATLDVNNGAGGSTTTFYTSTDGAAWTQLGATITTAGTFTINHTPATGVTIGAYQIAGQEPSTGKFYRAQVLNGINGTTALDVDFTTGIVNGAQTSLSISGTAADQLDNAFVLTNLGTGGPILNAQRGSSVGADTNDPQVLTHSGTNYLYLPGIAYNYASTPDAAPLDITGDIDLRARVALADWTPSGVAYVVAKWTPGSNQKSYALVVNTDGRLWLRTSPNGFTEVDGLSSVANGIADGSISWIRATLDVDDGAGNRVYNFYTSTDGTTWTQLGTTVTVAGATSIFNSSFGLDIGGFWTGSQGNQAMSAYRAQVLNGIGGTVVFDADFTTGITTGAQTTFTESSVNAATVTINRFTSGRKSVAVVQPTLLFGTDDYMEVASNDLLNFGATDSFTVVTATRVWANQIVNGQLISKLPGSGLGWAFQDVGGQIATIVNGSLGSNAPYAPGYTFGAITTNGMVVDRSTNTLSAYRNSAASSTVGELGSVTSSEPLRIGRGPSKYADMEFFGAAVWRRALSSAEIATVSDHYNGTVTAESLNLLAEAVFWIDPVYSKQAAVISRSTSGRKSVAVTRPTWLFGTDDYMEIADSSLLDFDSSNSFSIIAVSRQWNTQGTNDVLVAKKANSTETTQGWALTNGGTTALNGQAQIGDGSSGITVTSPSRNPGELTATALVRNTTSDIVTVYTGNTAGTSVTDTTIGSLSNSEAVRIGRLSGAGTEYLDAEIVAVAVIPRALNAEEVRAISGHYSEPSVLQAPRDLVPAVTTTNATKSVVGEYTIHTFNQSGTFTVTNVPLSGVEYLVVAGGGGGGSSLGAGGGAGGLLTNISGSALALTAATHTITVGAGGAIGTNGSNSSIGALVTAVGGGRGGASNQPGGNGGSGGGGGRSAGPFIAGGTATAGQGNNGGNSPVAGYAGGGGGGASQSGGSTIDATPGGNGGNGLASTITGVSVTYAGGGGGSANGTGGTGGTGGGGSGGNWVPNPNGVNGTDGLGGGGGGTWGGVAGEGGDGVVIVRYKTALVNPQPFSPLDLLPALWLDASDISTITESFGKVSLWADKSGNARNVSQGTAANQPTTGSATINGLNVVSFDGGDWLDRPSVDVISFLGAEKSDTMFFAVGTIESGAYWEPFNIWGPTYRVLFDYRGTWYFDVANASTARLSSTTPMSTGVPSVWAGYRNGSEVRMRLNGTLSGLRTTATGSAVSETATMQVGRFSPDYQMNGKLAEIIVVPGYSASGFASIETYLRNKWGTP